MKRIKRKYKVFTCHLDSEWLLRMRLIPYWFDVNGDCMWLASLAVAKSNRQINDWFNVRSKKSVRRLGSKLTGKFGNKTQAIAIRKIREWINEMPECDLLYMRCESIASKKQFQVWTKWMLRHELNDKVYWSIDYGNLSLIAHKRTDSCAYNEEKLLSE